MSEIKAKLKIRKGAYRVDIKGQLRLPFAARRTALHGEVLRGGDLVTAADGRVLEVVAEPEPLLQLEWESAAALARAAYHLGSAHVPVEVGERWLRLSGDAELEKMLQGLGAKLTRLTAPFEPEVGSHGGEHAAHGHDHDHDHGHHHHHGDDGHHHH